METWTTELIGPQIGKIAVITGGAQGIGLEVARELTRHGAMVIILDNDRDKGEKAVSEIRAIHAGLEVSFEYLEFSDLSAVKSFADKFLLGHQKLDLLIHVKEISSLSERTNSAQGFELMFAENYLAHFALTAKLFPLLEQTPEARVIFQSSPEHERGVIDFFDLDSTHYYDSKKAFSQSKLALLIFAKELDRRLRETKIDVKSIPVQSTGPSLLSKLLRLHSKHPTEFAAWPTLFAATAPEVLSGNYYSAQAHLGRRARLIELDTPVHAKNIYVSEKLWELSEKMTGVEFGIRDMSNILPFQMRGNIAPELFT